MAIPHRIPTMSLLNIELDARIRLRLKSIKEYRLNKELVRDAHFCSRSYLADKNGERLL